MYWPGTAIRLDVPEDFQISGIGGLGVQKCFILVAEIHAGIHIQKDIFAVGQAPDVQVQQGVQQTTGIDAGACIADAGLPVGDGAVHGEEIWFRFVRSCPFQEFFSI